jgi:hypothetical protein
MSYFGNRAIALRLASTNYDRIDAIDFVESDIHPLIGQRLDIPADVVSADRQFTLSAIDQHRELNRIGPAEISQGGERGAHRAAGIEDVVNQDDASAID